MVINYNKTFLNLIKGYGIPEDLLFEVEIPEDILKRLNDNISITAKGICLASYDNLYLSKDSEYQAFIEDQENHFHINEFDDDKHALLIGIKTMLLFAKRFEHEQIRQVRFWLSFQNKEMGKAHAKANGLHEKGDNYYVSDRLSFYRTIEIKTIPEMFEDSFTAILIIDI